MDPTETWALVCFIFAALLLVIEMFVPSMGLLGLMAVLSAIAGIILLAMTNPVAAGAVAVLLLLLAPVGVFLAIKYGPELPIARRLRLDDAPSRSTGVESFDHLQDATGKVLTDLRPVGTCLIGGRRIECLAEKGVIPHGANVRVIAVQGMEVKVREVE